MLVRTLSGATPSSPCTRVRDGLVNGPAVGDLLVRAGELARLLGEPARAAGHYRAFLAAFPRDQRAHLVRERLAGVAP